MNEELYHFSTGTIAGVTGLLCVFPIDSIKTRIQNQRTISNGKAEFKGWVDCTKKVVRSGGFRALYSGWAPACLSEGPKKAIRLTLNDSFRARLPQKDGKIPINLQIISGAVAGASDVLITNPFEMVKVRMQLDASISTSQAVKEIGFRNLFTGINACFLRDIPYSAIYFPSYSLLKDYFTSSTGELSIGYTFLAGFIAAIPAAGLTTPADVIKTRLQSKDNEILKYNGISHAARRIYAEEGFSALWKGAGLRCLRTPPQFAVTLFMYEWLNTLGHKSTQIQIKPAPSIAPHRL